MSLYYIFFFVCGVLAIGSGILTISARNPITSAMALIVHFFMLAGLYLTLNAQFIAVMQVLVYAGAIMVLVVFVIMLLNLGDDEKLKEKMNLRIFGAVVLSCSLFVLLAGTFLSFPSGSNHLSGISAQQGTVQGIGTELFSNYLFPFEAVSLLLLAAIIGAVILAKRKID